MKKIRDRRLDTDPDYINAPKYYNSINKLIDQNPDGISDPMICRVLEISKEELQRIYQNAIIKLRDSLHELDTDEGEI